MKRFFILFCLFFSCYFTFCQEIEAKFVSRLATRQLDNHVIVTWQNPTNFIDIVELYRSSTMINTAAELENATKIAELSHGEEEYVDTPNVGQNFYAAIIRNADNDFRNIIFVSFRNFTFKPINFEQEKQLEIKSVKATNKGDHIQIEWSYEGKNKDNLTVSIYRSLSPISSDFSLTQALKIANIDLSAQTYADMAIPNINYYYAIFFTDEKKHSFIPNVSVTQSPVYISQNSEVIKNFDINSFVPLPLLTFDVDPITGKKIPDSSIYDVPKKVQYSTQTEQTHQMFTQEYNDVADYVKQYRGINDNEFEIQLLDDEKDFYCSEFNLEYRLIQQLLFESNYLDALHTLENLLCESLSNSLRDRVAYYVGMIYFMQHNYKFAYIYLSLASNSYKEKVASYLHELNNKIFTTIE